ncbi:MAG: VOC family protein [Hyphomonadaceae bacterium]|nr:VOC family protein [Hyphomonadaceae bacterium]
MRLNQITVPAGDIAASAAFYKTLGFRQIVAAAHYARFEAPEGDATFSIALDQGAVGGTVVYLECDDLDATVARLKSSGIAFISDPKDESWLWREARMRDPFGNEICLYHAGKNRRFPPWRIDGRQA